MKQINTQNLLSIGRIIYANEELQKRFLQAVINANPSIIEKIEEFDCHNRRSFLGLYPCFYELKVAHGKNASVESKPSLATAGASLFSPEENILSESKITQSGASVGAQVRP